MNETDTRLKELSEAGRVWWAKRGGHPERQEFYGCTWGEIDPEKVAVEAFLAGYAFSLGGAKAWGEAAKKAEAGGFVGEEASRSLLEEADRQ